MKIFKHNYLYGYVLDNYSTFNCLLGYNDFNLIKNRKVNWGLKIDNVLNSFGFEFTSSELYNIKYVKIGYIYECLQLKLYLNTVLQDTFDFTVNPEIIVYEFENLNEDPPDPIIPVTIKVELIPNNANAKVGEAFFGKEDTFEFGTINKSFSEMKIIEKEKLVDKDLHFFYYYEFTIQNLHKNNLLNFMRMFSPNLTLPIAKDKILPTWIKITCETIEDFKYNNKYFHPSIFHPIGIRDIKRKDINYYEITFSGISAGGIT